MSDEPGLAARFDEHRGHLHAVAHRMLGSASEAEDAVQEAWLKLSRADTSEVHNFGGWLTTVVSRVCLDMLRSRKSRREEPLVLAEGAALAPSETHTALADAIGPALIVVLDTLSPAERVAFVLHDMFDLRFEEIASILGRAPAAVRQLASRGRRRVRGAPEPDDDVERRRELVSAFLAASRDGDLQRLITALSPDVVLRADDIAVGSAAARAQDGAPALAAEVRGASAVADVFNGRAREAVQAWIDGEPGAVWAVGEHVRAAFLFTVAHGRITTIELMMNAMTLATLRVQV